jgi:hypothetical protein
MTTATNPLLIALRAEFHTLPPHRRIYTTCYKAGGFRVKLYGTTTVPAGLKKRLARHGYPGVTVSMFEGAGWQYAPAVTIRWIPQA